MRKLFAGLMVAIGLFCGVTWRRRGTPATQPALLDRSKENPLAKGGGAVAARSGRTGPRTSAGRGSARRSAAQNDAAGGHSAAASDRAGQTSSPDKRSSRPSGADGTGTSRRLGGPGNCGLRLWRMPQRDRDRQTRLNRSTNRGSREFAQRMVRDHSPGCQEMQRLAGNLARTHITGIECGSCRGGSAAIWIGSAMQKEIGQQCLESVKEELSSKQGADFDKCFIGQQIGDHMKVIDELKVLRNHASSELKQKLDKELQTAEQHLQLAKQIEQKLKDHPSERVSRRPEATNSCPQALRPAVTCGDLSRPQAQVRDHGCLASRPGKAEFPRPAAFLGQRTASGGRESPGNFPPPWRLATPARYKSGRTLAGGRHSSATTGAAP